MTPITRAPPETLSPAAISAPQSTHSNHRCVRLRQVFPGLRHHLRHLQLGTGAALRRNSRERRCSREVVQTSSKSLTASAHQEFPYEPDLAVETKTGKLLCEPKRAKRCDCARESAGAAEWCKHSTDHARALGARPWSYALIPHDAITARATLDGLLATFGTPAMSEYTEEGGSRDRRRENGILEVLGPAER